MKARRLSSMVLAAFATMALSGAATTLVAQQPAQQNSQRKGADSPGDGQTMPGMDNMPGMDMDHDMPGMKAGPGLDEKNSRAEHGAMDAMSHMHHHQMGPHMYMTKLRAPASPADVARADEIASELRESIEKYKDYHVALADGFHIFMPNLPQPEYHFTNYYNGFLESFSFDPARPTSLLYKKTSTGYELIGAMYTMPKRVTEEQLNERVPLSIAQWHLHTKLCLPPKEDRAKADWTKFGLQGSILTKEACGEAGGTFYPVIFGWMVHVYPFENSRERVWTQ